MLKEDFFEPVSTNDTSIEYFCTVTKIEYGYERSLQ